MRVLSWLLCTLLVSLVVSSCVTGDVPSSGAYVAFSLAEAERELRQGGGRPEIGGLGGITRLVGMVYDRNRQDLILVGQIGVRGDERLRLEDLVVALRARLSHNAWPLVSIDKTAETKRSGLQTVRFQGGIENTRFGADLLNADIALKKLGLNEMAITGLPSYLDLSARQAESAGPGEDVSSRFWFVPDQASLMVRDGVFAIRNLDVSVQCEVMGGWRSGAQAPEVRDDAGISFAESLSRHLRERGAVTPDIARLRQLFAMVALAEGVRMLPARPNLDYWLTVYTVAGEPTPATYPLIAKEQVVGRERNVRMTIDGGIELRAMVSSLKDGDVTALRDLVIRARPTGRPLTWRVPLEGWRHPDAVAVTPAASRQESSDMGCYFTRQTLPVGASLPAEIPAISHPLTSPSFNVDLPAGSFNRNSNGVSGVDIAVKPQHAGSGGFGIREQALGSRPDRNTGTWHFNLKEAP